MTEPIPTNTQPTALSTDQVRTIVNRWCRESFFRLRRLGDRMTIDSITAHAAYPVRLWTQYEERSSQRVTVPYQGGYVDDNGRPPELWSINVRRPTDFEDRTEKTPVPHTECVQTCTGCTGMGIINCGPCQGWGKVTCPQCQGQGFRQRMVMQPVMGQPNVPQPSPYGETNVPAPAPAVSQSQMVREACTCVGGKVNCAPCQGRGKVPCTGCNGSGRVKSFEQLTVHFHVEDQAELLNHTQVPGPDVQAAGGTVLADDRRARIDTVNPMNPEVDRIAQNLLHKSHPNNPDSKRCLFQRLSIKQVGVHEVSYRLGSSPPQTLWIYGDEEKVHAPELPWAWWRLAAILGGIAGVIAIIVAVVCFFAFRS